MWIIGNNIQNKICTSKFTESWYNDNFEAGKCLKSSDWRELGEGFWISLILFDEGKGF